MIPACVAGKRTVTAWLQIQKQRFPLAFILSVLSGRVSSATTFNVPLVKPDLVTASTCMSEICKNTNKQTNNLDVTTSGWDDTIFLNYLNIIVWAQQKVNVPLGLALNNPYTLEFFSSLSFPMWPTIQVVSVLYSKKSEINVLTFALERNLEWGGSTYYLPSLHHLVPTRWPPEREGRPWVGLTSTAVCRNPWGDHHLKL